MRERGLRGGEKKALALLGLPTFGLALAITTVTTYLPVVARSYVGSTVLIGVIVGMEGLMALWVPLLAGSWSDRLRTRWGGRLPFLVVGTPVVALALLAIGLVRSVAVLVPVVAVSFAGYFLAYEPYRALYPDTVDDVIAGRAQSTQAPYGAGRRREWHCSAGACSSASPTSPRSPRRRPCSPWPSSCSS